MAPPLLGANRSGKDQRGKLRHAGRIAVYAVLAALALPVLAILVYRFVPPPVTPLMVIRWAQGSPIRQRYVPLDRISPALIRAVVASEDEKFCFHHGFDWAELDAAWRDWRAGRKPKGASTITMQTAKNLFLWPGRSILRKAIEAYLTVWIELLWSKPHIIETYLNVVEWGDGIYGADVAAQAHFHKPAMALSAREAALFAAVLPNPRRWSPEAPTAYIDERAATIRARMPEVAVPSAAGCR